MPPCSAMRHRIKRLTNTTTSPFITHHNMPMDIHAIMTLYQERLHREPGNLGTNTQGASR
jgi:hypothetical protein